MRTGTAIAAAGAELRRGGTGEPARRQVVACADVDVDANANFVGSDRIGSGRAPMLCIVLYCVVLCCVAPFAKSRLARSFEKDDRSSSSITEYGKF